MTMKWSNKTLVRTIIMMMLMAASCALMLTACGTPGKTSNETPDEIVLSWTGDPGTTQTVSWRGETEYAGVAVCNGKRFIAETVRIPGENYYRYTAAITGLLPGQTYQYRVGDGSAWSPWHRFTTETSGSFAFMYMGDIQYEAMNQDYKKWGNFIDNAYDQYPQTAFLLLGGDLVVNNGDLIEYEAVLKNGQPMLAQVPLMTTPGNHETDVTPDRYKELFALPENGTKQTIEEVYSFDYNNCHVVSLNSNLFQPERIHAMGRQKWNMMMDEVDRWLESDLSGDGSDFTIVFMHHPPYPILENLDIYDLVEQRWTPIFEKNDVDVVFVGHQHIYMRTKSMDGVTYIMARSGEKYSRYYETGDPIPKYVEVLAEINTYELVSVTKDQLTVQAFDPEGNLVDQWTKTK